MRTYRNSTAGSGRHVSACFKARRVHGEGPVVALHLCTHTCINMMFDMYVYRSPRVHIPWRHACENMLAQCPHRIAPYTLFDTCSHASKADPLIFFFGGKSPDAFRKSDNRPSGGPSFTLGCGGGSINSGKRIKFYRDFCSKNCFV